VGKTALIVDDSKSARVVLKKMLETHELDVDMAESAEDALDYLCDHRPDVIFMDHLMPGMDGFEAVSAIKSNPDTATIPIMMYTSQEGEVYVGQARALGAVGVLPKKIAPVEVSKVLTSLRVIGADRAAQRDGMQESTSTGTSGEFPGLETLDQDLRILIKDLFEQQRAVLRRDLLDSYETIASRVVHEIRPPGDKRENEVAADDARGPSAVMQAAISILVVLTIVFAWLYWQREQGWRELQLEYTLLQQQMEDQRASGVEDARLATQQLGGYRQSIEAMFASTLAGLEWGANQANLYSFDELPLGDTRLAVLEQLTEQLATIEFSGLIRIETHVADYCLSATGTDGYELAPGNLPAINCDRIGLAPGEAYELGLRQSVAFANFTRLADERSAGQIRYEIISLGNSDPVMDYPATPESVSAGIWNDIAAKNNRVEISVLPENY
jgi:CheY-like chemotaxis protein